MEQENVPHRSHSVGSLAELSHPAEKRIKDLLLDDVKVSPKRKLENTISSDHANVSNRKDKIIKESTLADVSAHAASQKSPQESMEDATSVIPLDKSLTQTISRDMDVGRQEENVGDFEQGAVCAEIAEETKKNETKKPLKVKKNLSTTSGGMGLEEIKENPSKESLINSVEKECLVEDAQVIDDKIEDDKDIGTLVSKPLKTDETLVKKQGSYANDETKVIETTDQKTEPEGAKPMERRKSRIYEQAEKFQNLIAASESKGAIGEKPKKVVLPGVSVDGYKKEFERKASLTSSTPLKFKGGIPKRISIDKQPSLEQEKQNEKPEVSENKVESSERSKREVTNDILSSVHEKERKEQVKNAVNIISCALDKEGARKSKSRPCIRKPPIPFGASGRSASGSIGMINSYVPSPIEEDKKILKVQVNLNTYLFCVKSFIYLITFSKAFPFLYLFLYNISVSSLVFTFHLYSKFLHVSMVIFSRT